MKLTKKQKEVIIKLRNGNFLFENVITPGAKWCIGKDYSQWGNVHGAVVAGLAESELLYFKWENAAVKRYSLTGSGQTLIL